MRSFRNATLNFGVATIQVGVAPGVRREKISFRTIHRECSTPVFQHWYCESCKKEVPKEETMSGIEVSKLGPWIPVEDSEIEAVESDFSPGIMLTKFIHRDQLNELMYDKGSWLIPNMKDPEGRYWALYEAMLDREAVGLGKQNLYETEQIVAVCAVPRGLVMFNLHAPGEIVAPDWQAGKSTAMVAKQTGIVIDAMYDVPEEEDFSRDDLKRKRALIEAKMSNKKLKLAPKKEIALPGDFMEQLKASVALAKANKKVRAGTRA